MESLLQNPLEQLGIPSVVACLLYLIVTREAFHRKEKRDAEINALTQRVDNLEKGLLDKLEKISEQFTEMSKSVYKIEGYIEGKNDKGK